MNAVKDFFGGGPKKERVVLGEGGAVYKVDTVLSHENGVRLVQAHTSDASGETQHTTIKRTTCNAQDEALLSALRAEAEILSELSDEPHLLHLLDHGEEQYLIEAEQHHHDPSADLQHPSSVTAVDISVATELYGESALAYCQRKQEHRCRVASSPAYNPASAPSLDLFDTQELARVCDITLGLCRAVCALHGSNPPIAHRGISLENVFYTSGPLPSWAAAVAGGTSSAGGGGKRSPTGDNESAPTTGATWKLGNLASATRMAMRCDTQDQVMAGFDEIQRWTHAAYRAPEMVDLWRRARIDQQADVWAIGVVFYALLFLQLPFDPEEPQSALQGKIPIPGNLKGHRIEDILHGVLSKEPQHRPDIWTLHNKILQLSRECGGSTTPPSSELHRPAFWVEQPLAPWCSAPPEPQDTSSTSPRRLSGSSGLAIDPSATSLGQGGCDDGPLVAPSTPTLAGAGLAVTQDGVQEISFEAMRRCGSAPPPAVDILAASVENPVIDDFDEVPRVHLVSDDTLDPLAGSKLSAETSGELAGIPQSSSVTLSRKGEGKVPRTVSAKLKDWAEKRGFPAKTLKLLHSDTPHAWVIRCTDTSFRSVKTLYLAKLVIHVKEKMQEGLDAHPRVRGGETDSSGGLTPPAREAVRTILYYLRLRPVHYNSLVAYKALFVMHHLAQELGCDVQRLLFSFRRQLFEEISQKWAGLDALKDDEAQKHLPLLHCLVTAYSEYLLKRVAYVAKAGCLLAQNDEDASLLSDVFIRGVELVEDIKPPLSGKRVFHNPLLVKMVLDLDAINQGLLTAPRTGRRWLQVEPGVLEARAKFEGFAELVSQHMPELQLSPKSGYSASPAVSPRSGGGLAGAMTPISASLFPSAPPAEPNHGVAVGGGANTASRRRRNSFSTVAPAYAASAAGDPGNSVLTGCDTPPGMLSVEKHPQPMSQPCSPARSRLSRRQSSVVEPGFDVEELYYMHTMKRCHISSVRDLLKMEGNDRCFDCRDRRRGILWASSSLGVFLCSVCVRFHSLVPFSSVKGVGDSFTPHELDMLSRIGNARATDIWLGALVGGSPSHGLEEDRQRLASLDPEGAPEEFQEFICAKYIQRKYIGNLQSPEQSVHIMDLLQAERGGGGAAGGLGERQETMPQQDDSASGDLLLFTPEKKPAVRQPSDSNVEMFFDAVRHVPSGDETSLFGTPERLAAQPPPGVVLESEPSFQLPPEN